MKTHCIFLFSLLFTFKAIAWGSQEKEINNILDKTELLHKEAKMTQQLESAMQALYLSNEHNYDEGKARAHFWAADALVNIGLIKEGFQQMVSIEATDYYKKEIKMQSETHRLKSRGYLALRLFQQAIQECQLQLTCTKFLKGEVQQKSYLHAFANLTTIYNKLGKADSVWKYIQLQLNGLKGLSVEKDVFIHIGVYDDLGKFYTKKGEFAKAESYLEKSLALIEHYKVPIFFNTMTYLGNLEQERGNFKKALIFFDKSTANMEKVGDRDALKNRYKFLGYYIAITD